MGMHKHANKMIKYHDGKYKAEHHKITIIEF